MRDGSGNGGDEGVMMATARQQSRGDGSHKGGDTRGEVAAGGRVGEERMVLRMWPL